MTKKATEKILVNGLWLNTKTVKPYPMEECEIDHIIDLLREAGEIARGGEKYPNNTLINDYGYSNNVINSPLTHMQGLVRYQIEISKEFAEVGISNADLETTSDFLCSSGNLQALTYQNSIRAKFLFHFLEQLVRLSNHPELIDEKELELFAQNFRGFFFLIVNQVNAGTQKKDILFRRLAYTAWVKMGRKESFSAQQFWNYVTSRLKEKNGEIETSITYQGYDYEAVISFGKNKGGTEIIKTEIVSDKTIPKELRKSSSKSFNQIKNIWSEVKKVFN